MTAWTVQCGYAAYYANTVVVEADTLDEALERAIAAANQDSGWKSLDHCGPTFVDAVARGVDADPWDGFGSAVPVPDRFTEAGEPPTVAVIVVDGAVRDTCVIGDIPVRVVVRTVSDAAAAHTILDAVGGRTPRLPALRAAVTTAARPVPDRAEA